MDGELRTVSESPELPRGWLEPGVLCSGAGRGQPRGLPFPHRRWYGEHFLRTTGELRTELLVLVTGHPVHRGEAEAVLSRAASPDSLGHGAHWPRVLHTRLGSRTHTLKHGPARGRSGKFESRTPSQRSRTRRRNVPDSVSTKRPHEAALCTRSGVVAAGGLGRNGVRAPRGGFFVG